MYTTDCQSIIKQEFLKHAVVMDKEKGYIVVEPLNLVLDPDLLSLASRAWAEEYIDLQRIDAIVGLPDAGSRLVSILADMLRIKKVLPSKRTDVVPSSWNSVVTYSNASFTTGKEDLVSNIGFVKPGMRLLIVDDVVARGETAISAIKALQEYGVEVVGMAVLFDKIWQGGVKRVEEETGISVFSLVSIESISESGEVLLHE
jgi:adenine/guanine phosphoribosyltransferase-like PRPP-binding protein